MNFRVLLHDAAADDQRLAPVVELVAAALDVSPREIRARMAGRPAWLVDLGTREAAAAIAAAVEARFGLRTSVAPSVGRPFEGLETLLDALRGEDAGWVPADDGGPDAELVPAPEHPRGWPMCGGPIPSHEAPRLEWPPPVVADVGEVEAGYLAAETAEPPVDSPVNAGQTVPDVGIVWRPEAALALEEPVSDDAGAGLELDWDRGTERDTGSAEVVVEAVGAGRAVESLTAEAEPRHVYDPGAWKVWTLALVGLAGMGVLVIRATIGAVGG